LDHAEAEPNNQKQQLYRKGSFMYILDVLIQGFRGKATHHGGLGLSTVPLLRGHGEIVLGDTGSYGYRVPLRKELEWLSLGAEDVTSVVLTHWHTRTRGKGGIK
jgi:glyoxylase-like metal-dependent hydrolase (beta-lactamase superfamily II)